MRTALGVVAVAVVLGCSSSTGDSEAASETTSGSDTVAETSGTGGLEDPCADVPPTEGGFVVCRDGTVLRPSVDSCTELLLPDDQPCPFDMANSDCFVDEDCAGPYGVCLGPGGGYCHCWHGCQSDEDCSPGQACLCDGLGGSQRCVPADCRSDADCDGDAVCMLSRRDVGVCALGVPEAHLACRPSGATCEFDRDCADDPDGPRCLDQGDDWSCGDDDCGIGEQSGRARTAP